VLPASAIVVNTRCAVALDAVLDSTDHVWTCEGTICAVRLASPVPASRFADGDLTLASLAAQAAGSAAGGSPVAIAGRWLQDVWDFVGLLGPMLHEDILALAGSVRTASLMQEAMGEHLLVVEDGATIEPYVIFDTSAGPIMVREGATISAFTRIVGPCYIGEHSTIIGDRVAACSIGEWCKIRGEMSSSIVLGHANKGHTGFVGHSYLGRWVNLGAVTTTSNLKNTYGTVQLWTPTGQRDTGLQFLGTLFGDHAKTGIGTMLTTGTVLGAGANVYGSAMPPKYVVPFSWGDGEPYATFAADKFLAVAERVMQRRHVTLGAGQRRLLSHAHATRAAKGDRG
jgi:UDP-N-acetylglucosamine diphosphorylase/glucosamine-1-phosphate N-acetyltransferase